MDELYENIEIQNGIMIFEDSTHLNAVIDDIIAKEATLREYVQSQPEAEFARYDAMMSVNGPFDGLNPFDESHIPDFAGDTLLLFDIDPILSCFQLAFAFQSLHRTLTESTLELLENDTYDPETNDPDNFFIPDDYLKAVLNANLEVQVGDNILKYLSSNTLVQILDGDMELLTTIRSEYPTNLSWTSDAGEPMAEDVMANSAVMGGLNIFVHHLSNGVSLLSCFPSFQYHAGPGEAFALTIHFDNESVPGYTSAAWNFGDGTPVVTDNNSQVSHTYTLEGTYSVTLTLFSDLVECGTTTRSVVVESDCGAVFTWQPSGNKNEFHFYSTASWAKTGFGILSRTWNFGDGNTYSTTIGQDPTHTYTSNGEYVVELTIVTNEPCTNNAKHTIVTDGKCCETNRAGNQNNETEAIGNDRGIKGKVWVTSIPFFYHKAGAKVSAYKNSGDWEKTKTDVLQAGIFGHINTKSCKDSLQLFLQGQTEWCFVEELKEREAIYARKVHEFHWVSHQGLKGHLLMEDNGAAANKLRKIATDSQCD